MSIISTLKDLSHAVDANRAISELAGRLLGGLTSLTPKPIEVRLHPEALQSAPLVLVNSFEASVIVQEWAESFEGFEIEYFEEGGFSVALK